MSQLGTNKVVLNLLDTGCLVFNAAVNFLLLHYVMLVALMKMEYFPLESLDKLNLHKDS